MTYKPEISKEPSVKYFVTNFIDITHSIPNNNWFNGQNRLFTVVDIYIRNIFAYQPDQGIWEH